jgi:hypothetical protein
VANYYIPLPKDLKKEQFRVIPLDIKNRVIKELLVSQGSLTSSIVRLATKPFAGRVKPIAHPAKNLNLKRKSKLFEYKSPV